MKQLKKKFWFWFSFAIFLDLILIGCVACLVYNIVLWDIPWEAKFLLPAAGSIMYVALVSFKEHFKFYKDCISVASASENK